MLNKIGGGNRTIKSLKDDDDFDDWDGDNKNKWGPVNNSRSASNAKPPVKIQQQELPKDDKPSGSYMWGGGGSKSDLKPSNSKTGLNSSFGGS